MLDDIDLDVSDIRTWRSIVTLIVFILTNLVVLFPFHITFFVPTIFVQKSLVILRRLRVIRPLSRNRDGDEDDSTPNPAEAGRTRSFTRLRLPLNFVTAPLIADLFLLAILAIGREEVYGGTVGSESIQPLDIMAFFLSLAYIAISIDASGLIRYLAFKVLSWGGKVGHRLFFYLYAFFFLLGTVVGNDPIILSGTAFLAYMTRVSQNIEHPRAWIHTQFAVANIASAILVSSNPTNLVLAGAFRIRFIDYTANMIVPVAATGVVLFPFLLYIIFAHERLIPIEITMHELPEDLKARKPINPNIPNARVNAEEMEVEGPGEEKEKLLLEEIMNPFLDKGAAMFGAVIMLLTLITVLALNAVSQETGSHPVYWVTVPACFVMFCWDAAFGWIHRHETREIARKGREAIEQARAERFNKPDEFDGTSPKQPSQEELGPPNSFLPACGGTESMIMVDDYNNTNIEMCDIQKNTRKSTTERVCKEQEAQELQQHQPSPNRDTEIAVQAPINKLVASPTKEPTSLVSLAEDAYQWCQETFPTVTAVLAHLPFALVPFALSMFVLVEALVTKGWVPVFSYGWDHWVEKTGTLGAIGGMAFLSVILCNFAGTNIGTTILLSRVIQGWQKIHETNGIEISDRDFWSTVYAMALGVNFGAFSTAFSASLAGLLWRDILERKHIHVRRLEFARVNLPIIVIAMVVGCAVLVGEVFIVRKTTPYSLT